MTNNIIILTRYKNIILVFVMLFSCFNSSGQIGIFKKKKDEEKQYKKDEIIKTTSLPDTIKNVSNLKKKSYNVALLLPFYLDSLDQFPIQKEEFEYEHVLEEEKEPDNYRIEIIEEITDRVKIYSKSYVAVSFYEGMMIALDSLQKLGFNCKLKVYDTHNDTQEVKIIRSKLIKDSLDLIIGPVYNSSLNLISDFAKNYKIPMVSPLGTNPEFLKENPFFIMANPSIHVQSDFIARFVYEKYRKENVLMIIEESIGLSKTASIFRKSFNELNKNTVSNDPNKPTKPFIKEINFSDLNKKSLLFSLSDTLDNILVVPSLNEAYISKLLNYLDSKQIKNITIVGLPDWSKFETIESGLLEKFNVHLPSSYFIDSESSQVKNFRLKYRNTFNTEPNKFAFQGYDVAFFYLCGMLTYGNGLIDNIRKLKLQGLHNNYNHTSLGIKYGHENSSVYVLKFQDYQFKRIK